MMNSRKKTKMTTTITTARRVAYEPLTSRSGSTTERRYCSSEIMDPDTYGGLLSSAPPPILTLPPPPPPPPTSVASSNTVTYETRSSSRRQHHHHHHKKRHDDETQPPLASTDSQDERIEVKILPQDDNWGETTTITCNGGNEDTLTNNNDTSLQLNDPHHLPDHHFPRLSTGSTRRPSTLSICHFAIYLLCLIAFISPVLFLGLPYALVTNESITISDYSPLLSLTFKLILIFSGTLILLYRRRNLTYLPRIHLQKMYLILLLTLVLIIYWFYFIYKILQSKIIHYERIMYMTSTYEDLLIVILIFAILIFEMKWLYPKWIVKIVRSPDGQTRQYTIGSMSIQEASIYLLEQYYKDFPVFNPWLENVQHTQSLRGHRRHTTFSTKSLGSQSNSSTVAEGRQGDLARSMRVFNDRFYDELDYERRVRKRRTKLLASCEEAFTHVRKCHNEKYGSHIPMDAREAAQAVFSSMSRSLQKYLRITRQQPYFTRESIIAHLATCLSHDLSPRSFLERYVQIESQPLATVLFPVSSSSTTSYNREQEWTLVCDPQSTTGNVPSINRSIHADLIVVLKQQHAEHISLMFSFHQIPQVRLIEKFFDHKHNKFVLKLNSETSV